MGTHPIFESDFDCLTVDQQPAKGPGLPWVEKYRPSKLDDLISHAEIIGTIQKFIDSSQLPHLLFYGPPGTGKTSTILAVAKQLYGNANLKKMVLELNASDDRGIKAVREKILNFASTRSLHSKGFKVIILDECDAMTKDAQNALRRVMEKYTENVRFCLICNYLGKLIPAIQSRCTRFRFAPLSREQMMPRINHVIAAESITITRPGLDLLLNMAGGDMRRSLNILQAAHMAYDSIDDETVYKVTGRPRKSDIITDLHDLVTLIEYPTTVKCQLLIGLGDIENRLNQGANERIQLGALCALFARAKEETIKDDFMGN